MPIHLKFCKFIRTSCETFSLMCHNSQNSPVIFKHEHQAASGSFSSRTHLDKDMGLYVDGLNDALHVIILYFCLES